MSRASHLFYHNYTNLKFVLQPNTRAGCRKSSVALRVFAAVPVDVVAVGGVAFTREKEIVLKQFRISIVGQEVLGT